MRFNLLLLIDIRMNTVKNFTIINLYLNYIDVLEVVILWMIYLTKNIRELSSISHGVMPTEFSFHFSFLWYLNFVINFPCFFEQLFRPMKLLLLRHPQNNNQIWLYKLNLMCEELSYQITNTSAVNQAVFCYY